jgi:hypothetical protein
VVDEIGRQELVDEIDPSLAEDLAADALEDVSLLLGRERQDSAS